MQILYTDVAGSGGIPAVHLDHHLEAVLLAAVEHPVDGTLLVGLDVILDEEGNDLVAHGADIVAAFHGLWHIVLAIKQAIHGHILVRHIRRQLILQAVNIDENAVKLFFVLFEVLKAGFALLLPCGFHAAYFSGISLPIGPLLLWRFVFGHLVSYK